MTRSSSLAVLLLTLLPIGILRAQQLELVPLPGYRGFSNCASSTQTETPCRLTAAPAVTEITTRLGTQRSAAWLSGSAWTLAYLAPDDSVQRVETIGGVQLPMSRVAGTRLWVLSLRLPGAEAGIISYDFWPDRGHGPREDHVAAGIWRGPAAAPLMSTSMPLKGRLKVDTLWSTALKLKRPVTSYLPPPEMRRADMPVVYLADGQNVAQHAPLVEASILRGDLPPLVLVGVWNARDRGTTGTPADDMRGVEYLEGVEGMPGVDSAAIINRRRAHETFFTQEVRSWAEASLGASRDARQRAVHGVSNGATFALRMGRDHPDLYGGVLANSHGSGAALIAPRGGWGASPAYFLAVGNLEVPRVIRTLGALSDTLATQRRPFKHVLYPGGHDPIVWREMFSVEVAWWLGQSK